MGRKAIANEPISSQVTKIVEKFTERREKLCLTQAEIGLRSGMGNGWVRRFERCEEKNPTILTLLKMAKALDLELEIDVSPKQEGGPV